MASQNLLKILSVRIFNQAGLLNHADTPRLPYHVKIFFPDRSVK